METLESKAKEYAFKAHDHVRQTYGLHPYSYHLEMVVETARRFINLIPQEVHDVVLASCYLHDVLEDVHSVTYNNIKTLFDIQVADIAYALTNEKGKTRKDRANAKYYQGIRNTKYATFVKCCDRIANIEHGIASGGNMVDMYRKEHEHFCAELFTVPLAPMFEHMENILLQPAHTL